MCVWQSQAPTGTSKLTWVAGCEALALPERCSINAAAAAPSTNSRRPIMATSPVVGRRLAETHALDHRLVPLQADAQHLARLALPPVLRRENLDVDQPVIAGRFDHAAQARKIDDAIARHAAVEQRVPGRHQPVADVIGEDA